ncbi:hypothetical protein [Reinekea sp.]|jgi:hypothetical protein|uniref:hypothetical protein n=1 Tax=Reinekea sp. TaxID=1970455 RepID=UPI002A806819|nr:hypothetical protein [Reinekea sp.]
MTDTSLFFNELAEMLGADGDQFVIGHPFSCEDIKTNRRQAQEQLVATALPLVNIKKGTDFKSDGLASICWTAQCNGREVQCVSALDTTSSVPRFSLFFRPFSVANKWREMVKSRYQSTVLNELSWELPVGTDTALYGIDSGTPLDSAFPFNINPAVVFESPVLTKPVSGISKVDEVVKHAAAVYGQRHYGPHVISPPNLLSFWEVSVSGVKIEVANMLTMNDNREVVHMRMCMRPWPAVRLFHDRIQHISEKLTDNSFLEFT